MNQTKAFTLPFRDARIAKIKSSILPPNNIEKMSIAKKWFVPDEEYLASVEDYAFVGA